MDVDRFCQTVSSSSPPLLPHQTRSSALLTEEGAGFCWALWTGCEGHGSGPVMSAVGSEGPDLYLQEIKDLVSGVLDDSKTEELDPQIRVSSSVMRVLLWSVIVKKVLRLKVELWIYWSVYVGLDQS